MKFHGYSGGEIVAMVHTQFEPRTFWNAGQYASNPEGLSTLYCPTCRRHGCISLRDEKHKERGVISPWFCTACKSWHRRPQKLTRRGQITSTGTQSQPGRSHWAPLEFDAIRILRAIDCMPREVKSWTLWVHTDNAIRLQPVVVNQAIIAVDQANLKPDNYAEGIKLYFFAEQLAVNERELMRTGRTKYSVEQMATGLGVGARQLQAGKKWHALREVIVNRYNELELEMDQIVLGALQNHSRELSAAAQ